MYVGDSFGTGERGKSTNPLGIKTCADGGNPTGKSGCLYTFGSSQEDHLRLKYTGLSRPIQAVVGRPGHFDAARVLKRVLTPLLLQAREHSPGSPPSSNGRRLQSLPRDPASSGSFSNSSGTEAP